MLAEPTAAERDSPGRHPLLAPTTHSCTPTNRCCRAGAGPGRRGTISSHRQRRRRAGHLRRHPPDAAERSAPIPGDARRPRPRRPGHRAGRDDLRPSDVHRRNRLPPNNFCRPWTTTGWSSPAPTTAGASTRTVRHPGLRAARRLGADWPVARPGPRRWHVEPRRAVPDPDHAPASCAGAPLLRAPQLQLVRRRRRSCRGCRGGCGRSPGSTPATTFGTAAERHTARQRVDAFLAEHGHRPAAAAQSPR